MSRKILLFCASACLYAATPSAPELTWFKTIGGSGSTGVVSVASDRQGNLYLAGTTSALDFPVMNAAQPHPGGSPLTRITLSSGAIQRVYSPALTQVTSVTVDPKNPQVLYAGSNAGLTRSTNGGATWTPLKGFPSVSNFNSLVIDPSNSKILYAGTQPLGVLKSTDSGVTWTAMNNGIPTTSENGAPQWDAYRFWIDPQSPNLLFVQAPSLLLRSANGGASWTVAPLPDFLNGQLSADPFASSTIYGPGASAFYKSEDAGQTWTTLSVLPDKSVPISISPDPKHQGTLYAGSNTGLFESTDGGQTWTLKVPGNAAQIAVGPNNELFANVAGLGVLASSDGFATYKVLAPSTSSQQLEPVESFLFVAGQPSSDVFVTKLDKNGNIVYSTYFGGSGEDTTVAMALGTDGSVYVTGTTSSPDFPVTGGTYASSGANFVFKLNPDGSKAWSTYFTDNNSKPYAITVDAAGSAYIVGQTS
ncbi:MAG TPA: SBBP repeat-containing protein, partial [Bryobacteraceae bacterium]|nr:SBBP repeat-containing protein [Bryobacteraceae bacterium]